MLVRRRAADANIARVSGGKRGPREAATIIAGDCSVVASDVAGTLAAPSSEGAVAEAISSPDRYALVCELGRGGMGRVDLLFDRALGRTVARKTAIADAHTDHLVIEAQIGAQLEHPSIVPVYDVAIVDGRPEYTMRVVRGRTLGAVLDDNATGRPKTPLAQLLGVLRQVCLAVDYAHSRGVVHRDLKPDNVILGEFGEVYVLDWGVAHVDQRSDLRNVSVQDGRFDLAGSPGYMAPEQAMGEAVDARTDVFALGVMLYEILAGSRPFRDKNLASVLRRITDPMREPPSERGAALGAPTAFDGLVLGCLSREPGERPASARLVADAIDAFLDGERQRVEREREADQLAAEGDRTREAYEALDQTAARLREDAERLLTSMPPWESHEAKRAAWDLRDEARRIASEAARTLARAEGTYAAALRRVEHHRGARAGLAALHYREFLAAEAHADAEKMAQQLDVARAYDDGALRLELADAGELVVEVTPAADEIVLERYEPRGPLLVPELVQALSIGGAATLVPTGSYRVTARADGRTVRYPLVIRRAMRHVVRLRLESLPELPRDMVIVPGGTYQGIPPRSTALTPLELPDFAIEVLPTTMGAYAAFLDTVADPDELSRRAPGFGNKGRPLVVKEQGVWRLADRTVEGEAKKRIAPGRELDIPVFEVCWFDACAFARWKAAATGLPYRLPTDAEWDKAMRGADGRAFPMGSELDPSFAKIRESRPEATQLEPVGAFPLDESPYGVRDLGGGVGDWTATAVDGGALPSLDHEHEAAAQERQVYWRGGNWGSSGSARGMRYPAAVRFRTTGVGFRLALPLSAQASSELVISPMQR
jgi:serine/threonine-protein kinase